MDIGGYFSAGMKRMGGGDWPSVQCVEKIQEMLSTAIKDQEDLWKILISSAPASALGESAGCAHGEEQLEAAGNKQQLASCIQLTPGKILSPFTAKLQNSLDWCHLALCRIKELTAQISDHPHTTSPPLSSQQASMIHRYPKLEHDPDGPAATLDHDARQYPCSKLELHRPFTSLRIPERTLDSCSLASDAGESFCRNPVTYCFRKSQKNLTELLLNPSGDVAGGGLDQTSLSMLASDLDPSCTQGQNFEGQVHTVGSGGMDADHAGTNQLQAHSAAMDNVAVDNKKQLLSKGLQHSSSSNDLKTMGAAAAAPHRHHFFQQNKIHDGAQAGKCRANNLQQGNHDLSMTSSKRNPIRVKRERETAASGEEAEKVVKVVYQHLRPGIDVRKGIPEDGHKGWKKYGNKSIQNANFCRGYYKCSGKDCNAKKMVQPTDEDPSVFEVTYMGTHTCCPSNYPRKKEQRVAARVPGLAADAGAEPTQESRKTPDHRQSSKRTKASRENQGAPEARQQKEKQNLPATAPISVKDEEKNFSGILMQPDHYKNNVVSSLYLPAPPGSAASTDQKPRMIAEEKSIDPYLQAPDFSTWSTELSAAAGSASADQLTVSSDQDNLAEALSSNNSSGSSDQDATATQQYDTATTHLQESQTFAALDKQQQQAADSEVELQVRSDDQTGAAAPPVTRQMQDHPHVDMQLEVMMNAAGDHLANSFEGFNDIHQHLHHLVHAHDEPHNATQAAFFSFHEAMFDSWADPGAWTPPAVQLQFSPRWVIHD